MGETCTLRTADETDRPVLRGFHRALYCKHQNQILPEQTRPLIAYEDYETLLEADIDALLADRAAHVLVAEREGRAIGYITARTKVEPRRALSRRAVLEDWYVEPEHRGHGVGHALLRALEGRLEAVGCEVLESGTWSDNEVGRRAHESLGFQEVRTTYQKPLRGHSDPPKPE
ncbi:MAG: GNAT family N-acetyltransferase [Myxococcota bacterium]